jgi:hypothetical protein
MGIRWKQGLLRLWVVASVLWIASVWWFNIGTGGQYLFPIEHDPFKPPMSSSQSPKPAANGATRSVEGLEPSPQLPRLTQAAWAFGPPIAILIVAYTVGWMRLPFFDSRRDDEVEAVATDLIARFGRRAHQEASCLAYLAARTGSRRDRVLYELVEREIDASFAEAQRRLDARQSASHEEYEGGADRAGDATELPELGQPAPRIPSLPRAANLVADLNLVDTNLSPRRRLG